MCVITDMKQGPCARTNWYEIKQHQNFVNYLGKKHSTQNGINLSLEREQPVHNLIFQHGTFLPREK